MTRFKFGIIGACLCTLIMPVYAVDLFLDDVSNQTQKQSGALKSAPTDINPLKKEDLQKPSDTKVITKTPTVNSVEDVKVSSVPTKDDSKQAGTSSFNQVAINLESILLRGDIQIFQEHQRGDKWSSILMAHVNPQTAHNDRTGDFGLAMGGRLYLDIPTLKTDKVFLMLSGGLDHFSGEGVFMALDLGVGYRMIWLSQLNLELLLTAHRSYRTRQENPELYLGVNMGINLDKPLISLF